MLQQTMMGIMAQQPAGASNGLLNNLPAHYSFDNDATDETGTNDGTATNITYSSSTKLLGTHSAEFNGTSSRVSVPANIISNIATGTYSINVWVYVSSHASNRNLYSQGNSGNDNLSIHFRINSNGTLLRQYRDGSSSNQHYTFTTSTVPTSAWSMITLVIDGDGTDPAFYINGSLASLGTQVTSGSPGTPTTNQAYIGVYGRTTLSDYFDGFMDAFEIRSEALGTSQIADLYNSGSGLPYSSYTS